jgi:plastocyanin
VEAGAAEWQFIGGKEAARQLPFLANGADRRTQQELTMKSLIALALIGLAPLASASAQAPQPATVTVTMQNFKFEPSTVQLRAGVPTILHLVNNAGGGHSFTAPEFFAASKIAPASQKLVEGGKVEVAKHSAVDVALTPAAGEYPLKCSHTLHATFGMKGSIVVR